VAVDRFFKSLERRTERDLYRKAFKATQKSQKDVFAAVSGGVKKEKRKKFALEVLWFFISILLGLVVGYTVYELVKSFSLSFVNEMINFLRFSNIEFIYLLSLVSFLGVYMTRITIWAVKLISN
tara:strand:- start:164 stop:535 length:372 start_codon:yes stop_codon:yes gene_type:complete